MYDPNEALPQLNNTCLTLQTITYNVLTNQITLGILMELACCAPCFVVFKIAKQPVNKTDLSQSINYAILMPPVILQRDLAF